MHLPLLPLSFSMVMPPTGTPSPAGKGKGVFKDIRNIPLEYADVDDITIAYRDFGSGDPLIMIIGFGSTMDMWNPPLLESLSSRHRVIIFDNRGMGLSGSSDEPYSIRRFAGDTAGLMDALGIGKSHVLGLSMGSYVAQELAIAHPGMVDSLILISGDCGGPQAVRMKREVWETLSNKSGTLQEQAERMFTVLFPPGWLLEHDPWQYCPTVYETTPDENIARQVEAFHTWPGTCDLLDRIRSRTLIITGTDDVVVPPENSLVLAERVAGAWLVRFRSGGHGLMYQYPEKLGRVIALFLETMA